MKKRKKELSLTALLLVGVAISIASIILFSFIFSVAASVTADPGSIIGLFSLLSLLLAGIGSGFIISKLFGNGSALPAFLSSVITAFLMCIIGLAIKGGAIHLSVLLNYLAYLGSVAVISLISTRKRSKKMKFK